MKENTMKKSIEIDRENAIDIHKHSTYRSELTSAVARHHFSPRPFLSRIKKWKQVGEGRPNIKPVSYQYTSVGIYRKISNIRRTKSQNLNLSRLG